MIRKKSNSCDGLNRAGKLLSRRRYTVSEMKEKLAKGGCNDDEIQEVVDYLLQRGYLDDADYVRAYVSDKTRFHRKGALLLKSELEKKGVDRQLIEKVLSEEYPREQQLRNARELLEKWNRENGKSGDRLLRKLAAKGYPADVCIEAVGSLFNSVKRGTI